MDHTKPSPSGYRLTWREGQLRPIGNKDLQSGSLFTGEVMLETNPDTHEFHKIQSIDFRGTGGRGTIEVFANGLKCAVLEYNGTGNYHVEINPHGKVLIMSSSHKNHEKIDIKNPAVCEFSHKLDKHHFKA